MSYLHNLLMAFLPRRTGNPLTLAQLELSSQQKEFLKALSKEARQALLDACQQIVLTSNSKDSRAAAKRLKQYIRSLTLSENNRLPSDGKIETRISEYMDEQ